MFCPNCGAGEQQPNAFCKRCGVWLTEFRAVRRKSPEESLKAIAILSGVGAGFMLFSTIVLYALFFSGNKSALLGVAAAFCFAVLIYQIFNVVYSLNLRQRIKHARESADDEKQRRATDELNAAQTFASLEAANTDEIIPPPSVTEDTTRILEPLPRESRKGRGQ
jgi:hypothetical protein